MSLSIKDTTPSAWDSFVATHKTGDVVRGKISRFAGFGVFVELGNGLEGLCHISELADERVEKPEDVVSIGQEVDFKILRIEYEDQKIGLSHRAVGKNEEPIVDTRNYSTEAKGGMASLGELMNLKRGEQPKKKLRKNRSCRKKKEKPSKLKKEPNRKRGAKSKTIHRTKRNRRTVTQRQLVKMVKLRRKRKTDKKLRATSPEVSGETAETTDSAELAETNTEPEEKSEEAEETPAVKTASEADSAKDGTPEAEKSEAEETNAPESPAENTEEVPLLTDTEGEATAADDRFYTTR